MRYQVSTYSQKIQVAVQESTDRVSWGADDATILGEAGGDTADLFFDSFRELRDELIADTSGTIEALVELWDQGARQIAEAAAGPEVPGGPHAAR